MKPPLTPELKERFFAQYLGQGVLCLKPGLKEDNIVLGYNIDVLRYNSDAYLSLRPLLSIVDEEAVTISKIVYGETCSFETHENAGRKVLQRYQSLEDSTGKDWLEIWDYLRSVGIAIPFMGHTVDDLVNAGWVKLREQ